MNFEIISGSHRADSQSLRISHYLSSRLKEISQNNNCNVIELLPETLPLWSPNVFKDKAQSESVTQVMARIQSADALIVVAPEWGGMAPPALKNFLLWASQKELAHKPCLICGVSSARGGAFPIHELRGSGYKNNRVLFLSEHLIIRDCESQFTSETPRNEDEKYLRTRVDRTLELLARYAQVLKDFRKDPWTDQFIKDYPNGMS